MKKEKQIRIRINDEQFRQMDTILKSEMVSKSEFIRQAINDKIKRFKRHEKK
jgi:metal-responsive CopG/Arc/MetJ family transcriptional regulator